MRYLLMVQLNQSSDMERVRRDVPGFVSAVKRVSSGSSEIAYRSSDGLTFGIMFQADEDPQKLQSWFRGESYFLNGDGMVVVELGDLRAGLGSSRAWTWLQRHP